MNWLLQTEDSRISTGIHYQSSKINIDFLEIVGIQSRGLSHETSSLFSVSAIVAASNTPFLRFFLSKTRIGTLRREPLLYMLKKESFIKLLSGMRPELDDVVELMQRIQSRLPVKEAARTSVLSKSWLHAWSTIPTLRFNVRRGNSMKLVDVDRTLTRYLRDNTPIERFVLMIDIENQESASLAEEWIRPVASKTCLKVFFLSISLYGASFTLPDEMFLGENLTKIRVSASHGAHSIWMATSPLPVIKCVSLRELHLDNVRISEEVLHDILSSCRLLEKIELLDSCEGFETIKVKNLHRLYKLQIDLDGVHSTSLQISDVPNLGVFTYNLDLQYRRDPPLPFNAHSISLGSNVTQLRLGGVVTGNACLDMIKLGFPFLESLTLVLTSWILGSFHFTCASIKRLTLFSCPRILIDVQVHAPKLLFFEFNGFALPDLLFPVSSLDQIKVSLKLDLPVDVSFFLKMREVLMLSHKCYLLIDHNSELPLGIDIDDLKTRLLFPPATNVQQLSFETSRDKCLWERSPFFDAFFEICRPMHVLAKPDTRFRHNNHFCRLMLREVLELNETRTAYWPRYLKHVQMKRFLDKNWETLTKSNRSFLDGLAPGDYIDFKLEWH
ncbi:hypothetical protein L2E82_49434 [Cichorium intybus]|uniref:Uncharacterized protein n=1 Tax=Cichorium intybus TaxID=13427 RepID=A0ACB8YZP6_CICIN|nr:hypothetical protein L2E82_49434 [Cichorium intybus]